MWLGERYCSTLVLLSCTWLLSAGSLRTRLGLKMFNFDLIRDSRSEDNYYIIDINYFPGYEKLPHYAPMLAAFLKQQIALTKQLASAPEVNSLQSPKVELLRDPELAVLSIQSRWDGIPIVQTQAHGAVERGPAWVMLAREDSVQSEMLLSPLFQPGSDHFDQACAFDPVTLADSDERASLRKVHGDCGGGRMRVIIDAPFWDDPPPTSQADGATPTPGLWDYEVVEIFIAHDDFDDTNGSMTEYLECELGPHGHFIALKFRGQRQMLREDIILGDVRCRKYDMSTDSVTQPPRWRGTFTIPHELIPPAPHKANAYAIHGVGPSRQYCCCHPVPGPGGPDFHRTHHFKSLRLPLP